MRFAEQELHISARRRRWCRKCGLGTRQTAKWRFLQIVPSQCRGLGESLAKRKCSRARPKSPSLPNNRTTIA